MKRIKDFLNKDAAVILGILFLLVVSLIPLVLIGRYNIMSADDYAVGIGSNRIWKETHSIWQVFMYAIERVQNWYYTWQGSFTYVFCGSWNPGFFNEKLVWMTPTIMILSILLSFYVLLRQILKKFFTESKKETITIWAAMCFLMIQTMPSPVEGLFWFSGAVGYTMLQMGMLLFLGFCISLENTSGFRKAIGVAIAFGWAFAVGGSQYITALQAVLLYSVLMFLDYKRINWWKILTGVLLLTGFLINVLAPGNSARKGGAGGLGAVEAILCSFKEALKYGKSWVSPILVCAILFLFPFVWKCVSNAKKEFTYPYPLLVMMFSFCIFSAAFTPSLYGVGNVDAGRIQNLIQSVFYIVLLTNLFYWIGWLQYRIKYSRRDIFRDIKEIKDILVKYQMTYKWIGLCLMFMVFIGTADKNTFSSVSALRSLANGEAKVFYEEAQKRIEIYQDNTILIAQVENFSVRPWVLFFSDVVPEGDANFWINENIAKYYGKEKVILRENQ